MVTCYLKNVVTMDSFGSKVKKSLPGWCKKRFSVTITESDPSCKVVYLGNVLTGWAKGKPSSNSFTVHSSYNIYIVILHTTVKHLTIHTKLSIHH